MNQSYTKEVRYRTVRYMYHDTIYIFESKLHKRSIFNQLHFRSNTTNQVEHKHILGHILVNYILDLIPRIKLSISIF
jgi:hypothetical protein